MKGGISIQKNYLTADLPETVAVNDVTAVARPAQRSPAQRLRRLATGCIAALLLAFMPAASLAAAAMPDVYAGGQSIGVLLSTEGVSVVGLSPAVLADGSHVNPAEDAGIRIGDFITAVNGEKVDSNAEIASLIAKAGEAGESCIVDYLRNGIQRQAELFPCYCYESGSYRIGLYVRDNTAGVGTLTFWEPISGIYGALGHTVSDLRYGVEGENKGLILRTDVQGIRAGAVGTPGEKLGVFLENGWQGSITRNGEHGIYGQFDQLPAAGGSLLPVASSDEVELGAAQLYTVLSGEEVECFDVQIVKQLDSYLSGASGMVIEITDERLLAVTGGIIQGMSGSPLIQNGRLIGAVTHVFVNDPTQGYACYAEQMLEEAGLTGL